jgi:hypothetical protein
VVDKHPHETITVADLESIFMTHKFLRESDLEKFGNEQRKRYEVESEQKRRKTSEDGVAFPQPSVMSYRDVTAGCVAAATVTSVALGISVAPNLWLVSGMLGGLYGYQTGKDLERRQRDEGAEQMNVVQVATVAAGRRLARAYLKANDVVQTYFFLYKTGQLSYAYYKQYAKLDERYAIQQKIDAWNERFVEGKKAFDKWEKENEVGRKVLATLRTVWLVEERSLKKHRLLRRRTSKYRAVQFFYDGVFALGRLWRAAWKGVTGRGGKEWNEFVAGITKKTTSDSTSRVTAAFAALIVVYLTGLLFTVAPKLLALTAILVGLAWPSWISELLDRLENFIEETRARGRGEEYSGSVVVGKATTSKSKQKATLKFDKNRYHYYRKMDGKKRFYRVGQPWFGPKNKNDSKTKKRSFVWPWQRKDEEDTKPSGMFDWGWRG